MDIQLFLRILLGQLLIIGVVAFLVFSIVGGEFDKMLWTLFVLIYTIVLYSKQVKAMQMEGIAKGDENYLKVSFEKNIETHYSLAELEELIVGCSEMIGTVYLSEKLLVKRPFRGVLNAITSRIEIIQNSPSTETYLYRLTTKPKLPFIKVDDCASLKIHTKICKLIEC